MAFLLLPLMINMRWDEEEEDAEMQEDEDVVDQDEVVNKEHEQ